MPLIFFATGLKFNYAGSSFYPYLGALVDYTAPQKRDNVFSASIKRDILGTVGMAWKREGDNFAFNSIGNYINPSNPTGIALPIPYTL